MSASFKPPIRPKPESTTPTPPQSEVIIGGSALAASDSGSADPVLVLTQDDLNALSRSLGLNILTRDDLLKRCHSLTHLSVDGYSIRLEPRLLSRLKSRAIKQEDFGKWIADLVVKLLSGYAGC